MRTIAKKILSLYPQWVCRQEYEKQSFDRFNERAVELAFVFKHVAHICPEKVLDVGTGMTALPHLLRNCGSVVTAIDNVEDYWTEGMVNRHYHVIDEDITETELKGPFDLITCVSVLEHITQSDAAVRNMFRLLATGGYLLLTIPYTEHQYVRNVYELPGATYGADFPYVTQSYSRAELSRWMADNEGEILEQEYWQFWEGDVWVVGSQVTPPRRVEADETHQLSCIVARKAAGGPAA